MSDEQVADAETSTLECPTMEPLSIPCKWKGFSGNANTCRIGFQIHKNRLGLDEAVRLFNQRRLTVLVSTREMEQPSLYDGQDEDDVFEVVGSADTKSIGINGDHYNGGLTFGRDEVEIETLANCGGRNGTLVIRDVSSIPVKAKNAKPHPDVQMGEDRPRGFPALQALGQAAQETEIAKLCGEGSDKPVLSAAVAMAMSQQGIRTCADLQKFIDDKPEWWEADLKKNVKGLGAGTLEKLVDAYQLFMATSADPDGGRRLCNECATLHSDKTCPSCRSEFFQAVHDETLNDIGEWGLADCERIEVAEDGPVKAEQLLKEDEFGQWHYGTLVTVSVNDEEADQYGFQPSIAGNKFDRDTALMKSLESLVEELEIVAADYPGESVKKVSDSVALLLP